jgi:hypothetical protein
MTPRVIGLDKNTAIKELAHVAESLLERLNDIDTELPGSMRQALQTKIAYYANYAEDDAS